MSAYKKQQAQSGPPIRTKFVRGALNAPLTEVDNPGSIGVDRWRQVDLLGPSETNLMVAVGLAEHPTRSVWEARFWWHQITLILSGHLTVQDLDTGAIYRGGEGDLFYWAPGLRARLGGSFRSYFVKTPAPTRWVKTPGGKKGLEMLNRDDEIFPSTPADEMMKAPSKGNLAGRRSWPRIKFVKGARQATAVKVDDASLWGGSWRNIALVNPLDTNLVLNAGIAHPSNASGECDHRWHQMVLVLDGEMVNEDLETGEVFRAHEGDFYYWQPGLLHEVRNNFRVLAVVTPVIRRWVMTPEGKRKFDLFQLENEIIIPGSPPDKVQRAPLNEA